MAQPEALLDTDVLSAVMKGNPLAVARAGEYIAEHGSLTLSIITRYEILRGLKAKNATTQVQAFDHFCEACHILPLTDEVVVRASEIYADSRSSGRELAKTVIGESKRRRSMAKGTKGSKTRNVPGEITLRRLDRIIQTAVGWTNYEDVFKVVS